jgi:hypothetical protein
MSPTILKSKIFFSIAAPLLLIMVMAPAAHAGTPCCSITSINKSSGIVTAKVNATGKTFQFKASPQTLSNMKVGQGVYANFKTQQVSVNGAEPCCDITAINAAPLDGVRSGINAAPLDGVRSGTNAAPLDGIRSGTNAAPLDGVRSGTNAAPLDGVRSGTNAAPLDGVRSTSAAPLDGARVPANVKPAMGTPCCDITAINPSTGIVTAKVNATGKTFQFKGSSQLLNTLKVGQGVFANFSARQVSVNGEAPCCNMTSAPH